MANKTRVDSGIPLTDHAVLRMQNRRIAADAIETVINYGREVPTRGATVYAIGKKEIRRWSEHGIDLSELEGVQVVCSQDEVILTVYRNRDFRWLRRNLGRGRHRPRRTLE